MGDSFSCSQGVSLVSRREQLKLSPTFKNRYSASLVRGTITCSKAERIIEKAFSTQKNGAATRTLDFAQKGMSCIAQAAIGGAERKSASITLR